MTSAFSWQSSVSLCPASFCTPKPNLPVKSRYLLTSYFCIPVSYDEKDIFFCVLVLEGLVGLHKTVQLQLLQNYSLGHLLLLPFTQSCQTLCDPMDSSLPGSTIHGIFQARILEWAAISVSRGSSQPRDQTRVSCIANRHFTI